ncbi:MAG: AEC family transporter [Gammaproteobacteria bacterium]|nr:AEC family transporter [Gammaproteobacteria bacterium]
MDQSIIERVFATVFPIVAICTIGYGYGRWRKPDIKLINQINMEVFVPLLVFVVLADQSVPVGHLGPMALGAIMVVLGSGLLLWPVIALSPWSSKTFLPPMMFNNVGNMGIPLILLAFGDDFLAIAVVCFIVEMTLHFSLGIFIINPKMRLISLLKQPVMLATLAGFAVALSGFQLPDSVHLPIDMLGQICIPLMLFTLGIRLTSIEFGDWKVGLIGAVLCPISGIIMAVAAQTLLQLPPQQYAVLLVFGALPPAVLNYMVAEQYQQEPKRVASIVLIGNLVALISIPFTLTFVL